MRGCNALWRQKAGVPDGAKGAGETHVFSVLAHQRGERRCARQLLFNGSAQRGRAGGAAATQRAPRLANHLADLAKELLLGLLLCGHLGLHLRGDLGIDGRLQSALFRGCDPCTLICTRLGKRLIWLCCLRL